VLVGVAALGVLVWLMFATEEEGAAPTAAQPSMTQVPAPPIRPPGKAEAASQGRGAVQEDKPTDAGKPAAVPSSPKPREPRFSFYKILPEKEVIIAESEIKTIKREETQGKKPDGGLYVIQAGSFTRAEDAEKLRARLSRLRVKAKIESVRIENVDWHRVKIGPFESLVNADQVRVYLRANQIDSVVQRAAGR
jgi:cell division protein FtsN